jgi:signal transduction histidine kinase
VTNAVKHAGGSRIVVTGDRVDDRFRLRVVDDGVGGARIEPGGGLAGLADRLDALGGSLTVAGPPGRGTTVTAELPCGS